MCRWKAGLPHLCKLLECWTLLVFDFSKKRMFFVWFWFSEKTRFICISTVFALHLKLNKRNVSSWTYGCKSEIERNRESEMAFTMMKKYYWLQLETMLFPIAFVTRARNEWNERNETQWMEWAHKIPTRLGHHYYYSYMKVTVTTYTILGQTSPYLTYFHTWQLFRFPLLCSFNSLNVHFWLFVIMYDC